ncbi:MAG: YdcF family protein, partial [Acidobacteriaceae bacterium]|nr:YdcF family protein [Acidobacteriaceae bacterium]
GMRILTAAQLAQAGYAPYVIVDGPKSLLGNESDATIQYAVGKGYAQSQFRPLPLPDAVRSTRAEADFVGRSLKERRIDKILLVTSNYHTRRAAQLFRRSNPKLQIVVIAAPDPNFTPSTWWKSREGQKTFALEWMKTIAYWFNI